MSVMTAAGKSPGTNSYARESAKGLSRRHYRPSARL
jgi:hypothetical protein